MLKFFCVAYRYECGCKGNVRVGESCQLEERVIDFELNMDSGPILMSMVIPLVVMI